MGKRLFVSCHVAIMDAAQRVARLCCWLGHVGFLSFFFAEFLCFLLLLFVESVRYDTKGKQTSILAEGFYFILLYGLCVFEVWCFGCGVRCTCGFRDNNDASE